MTKFDFLLVLLVFNQISHLNEHPRSYSQCVVPHLLELGRPKKKRFREVVNKQTMGAAVKTESHIPPTTKKKTKANPPPKKSEKMQPHSPLAALAQ